MRRLRTLLYGSALYHLALQGPVPRRLALRLDTPWPGEAPRGEALLNGTFRFAADAVHGAGPPWSLQGSPAWQAELHRFRWLADLAALGSEAAATAAHDWSMEWLRHFDLYEPLAWRADILGDRLFAWIEHFDLIGGADRDADHRLLLPSLARQARHLARVAVREAAGLPRLQALRGLVMAAAALEQRRALTRALQQLESEAAAQMLPDGGHRSRSGAAQLACLRCLVETRAALLAAAQPVPEFLQQAIERAAPMLRFFRHGDGKLALFNGAVEMDPASIDLALARAEARARAPLSATDSGFERLQAGGTLVLFDCGKPAPAGFDGDAHAGILSFEMSHGRERLIVNCGAYDGPNAEWRMAMRATAAHSALVVADTNSVEIRPDGTLSRGPDTVSQERTDEDGNVWASASHDGYRRPFGLTHVRQLFLAADGDDLRGEDSLTGSAGRGFAIRFHLHPEVEATLAPEGGVLLRLPGGSAWRFRAEGAVLSLGESIYLGSGAPRKSRQVLLDGHVGTHGATVRWAIRRTTPPSGTG